MVEFIKPTIRRLPDSSPSADCGDMETDSFQFGAIGARLRKPRDSSGLNQKAWAERHGFNLTQYNNWERGDRRIPLEHAETLCDRYGLTLDFIYRGRLDGLSEYAQKVV